MKLKNQILLMCLVFLFSCRQKPIAVSPPLSQVGKERKSIQTLGKKAPFVIIETIATDLDDDQQVDSIVVLTTDTANGFERVEIKSANRPIQQFQSEDGWVNIYPDFAKRNKNGIKSNRIFVQKNKNESYILLFGTIYGSGLNELTIISIKNGVAKKVFSEVLEVPMQIGDFNKDGLTYLLGTNLRELESQVDSLDASIGSYTPYLVYSIGDSCEINIKLTEQYNKEHYVWAGLTNTQNIRVLYPKKGGKPKLVK